MSWSNVYRVPLANTKYARKINIFMLWLHLSHNCVHGIYTLLCNTCSANVFAFGVLTLSWELLVQSKSLFACPKVCQRLQILWVCPKGAKALGVLVF